MGFLISLFFLTFGKFCAPNAYNVEIFSNVIYPAMRRSWRVLNVLRWFFSGLQTEGDAEMIRFQQNCKAHRHVPLLSLLALRWGLACFASGRDHTSLLTHCLCSTFDGQEECTFVDFDFWNSVESGWSLTDPFRVHRPFCAAALSEALWRHNFCLQIICWPDRGGGCPLNSDNQRKGVCLGAGEECPLLWCPLWPQWPRLAKTPAKAFKAVSCFSVTALEAGKLTRYRNILWLDRKTWDHRDGRQSCFISPSRLPPC